MRALVLAAAALLVAAAPAAAQDPGTEVGGTVDTYLGLGIDAPEGFATFPAGPGEHELELRARVTATAGTVMLGVADGDAASGARLGRMAGSAGALREPLEARVRGAAFQPLDAVADPLLAAFRAPLANREATIELRQRIRPGERPRGSYAKTVLITLSVNAP